jgi:PAS domain S-box-containing protein
MARKVTRTEGVAPPAPLEHAERRVDWAGRRQADAALNASERRYRALITELRIGVLICGSNAEIIFSNPKAQELLGLADDQLAGKTPSDQSWNAIHDDGTPFPGSEHPVAQAIATGRSVFDAVMGFVHPATGERIWLLVQAHPDLDDEGRVRQVVCTFIDITSRRQVENDLRDSEARHRAAMDNSPLLMTLSELSTGRYIEVNDEFCAVSGFSREEALGRSSIEMGWLGRDDRARMVRELEETGKVEGMDLTLRRKDGRTVICRCYGDIVRTTQGDRLFLAAEDITERKRSEAQVVELNRDFSAFLENTGNFIYYKDTNGRFRFCSQPMARVTGHASWRDLIGKTDLDVFPEEAARLYVEEDREILHGAAPTLDRPDFYIDAAGHRRWSSTSKWPLLDESGRVAGVFGISRDVTEQHRQEQAVKESESRLRDITASMGEWVWEVDAKGVFTYSSAKGIELFGDVVGKTPCAFVTPDEATRIRALLTQAAAAKAPIRDIESQKITKNGETIWLLMNGTPILDAAGRLQGYRGVDKDITARKAVEGELVAARNAADAANRTKSEFLANMSHEIRTPLNGILGYVQLLELEPLTPAQREYLAAISTSGKNLSELINDIIDMSKIEAERVALEHEEFSVRACLMAAVTMQRARAAQKGLPLQVRIADDMPASLVGDELRLRQVVLNLLSNAVKFTERGSITISAAVRERTATTATVEIAVTDTGIGMSSEATQAIFEPFVQADSSVTRRFGGSGLGLAISRRLIELMGGRISVESVESVGSTFSVLVPLSLGRPVAELPELVTIGASNAVGGLRITGVAGEPGGRAAPHTVLLVEDNEMNQRFGMTLLKTLGYAATLAADGEAALAALDQARFDVVLMDIQMPVMDGRKALKLLRKRESPLGRHTPVIALTAFALKGDAERFLVDGFDGYLSKPLLIQDLIETIRRAVTAPGSTARQGTT